MVPHRPEGTRERLISANENTAIGAAATTGVTIAANPGDGVMLRPP
jgi:hypothetical protein